MYQYTTKDIQRFWSKVNKNGSIPAHMPHLGKCWEWEGSFYSNGYGRFFSYGAVYLAHRFAWAIESGLIPDGMIVMHRCDNPACVRKSHLRLGTHAENSADMVQKGRNDRRVGKNNPRYGLRRTHCNKGHKLTEDNVVFTNRGKSRRCKICYETSSHAGSLRYRANHRNEINEKKRISREPFKKGFALGEGHGLTTLTSNQVLEIRAKHKSDKTPFNILAKEYGVSPATIGNIIHRKTWKHI